ncbi:MAG TPA: hypothetical protein LFW13_05540, partial [Rickettsia endosymbiont of Sericostoma sp.]|nr:hypothetical protein [Rickettsia endosymbiont of Sericostoma sp.]
SSGKFCSPLFTFTSCGKLKLCSSVDSSSGKLCPQFCPFFLYLDKDIDILLSIILSGEKFFSVEW